MSVNVFEHGGRTRKMLTLEIDRFSQRGKNVNSAEEVLREVSTFLIQNGCGSYRGELSEARRKEAVNYHSTALKELTTTRICPLPLK